MNFAMNIEVKKEDISSEIDYYEDVHWNNNNKVETDTKSNIFHKLKSEHEVKLEGSGLKDYSFEECGVCRSVFPNKYGLLQHHLSHLIIPLSRLDLYQCHYCEFLFTKKTKLDDHMNIEHENNEQKNTQNKLESKTQKTHDCGICNKTYTYRNWHEHLRTVHGNVNLTCDQCGKSFKCQKYLYRHMQNIHSGKMQLKPVCEFVCKQCPKTFNSGDCLNKHVKNCHGQKVTCKICNSVLKSVVYLSSHMRRVHCDSSKKSKCKICGKEMKSKRQVRIHVNNTHGKMLCSKCGQLYTSLYPYHVKHCKTGIVTQNVRKGKIRRDNMNVDITVDDNDYIDIKNGQDNRNPNIQDDLKVDFYDHVKIDINDQLNIKNKGRCKRCTTAGDMNKHNPIYQDDIEDVDVDDSGLNIDLSDQVNGGNVRYYDIREIDSVTAKGEFNDNNIKEGSLQRDISDHINGNPKDHINTGDINGHFCKICYKKLKSEERIKIHMKNAHSKMLPIKCDYCGKFYFNVKYFYDHVKKCSTKKLDAHQIKIENTFKLNEWAFKAL